MIKTPLLHCVTKLILTYFDHVADYIVIVVVAKVFKKWLKIDAFARLHSTDRFFATQLLTVTFLLLTLDSKIKTKELHHVTVNVTVKALNRALLHHCNSCVTLCNTSVTFYCNTTRDYHSTTCKKCYSKHPKKVKSRKIFENSKYYYAS
jgi:hypothetical protein